MSSPIETWFATSGLIYREFGTRCMFRCLWVLATRRTTTFLDVVSQRS